MSASRKKRLGASRIQGRGDAIEDSVDQLRGQQQVIRAVGKELREKEEEVRKKEAEVRKKEAELRKMEEELRKLEVEAEEEKEQEEDSGDLFGSSLDFVFGPPNTARKERMYMHTPVRVGIWDVVKEIEDYVSNADKDGLISEMDPNCCCSESIKKGHAECIPNSFLQVYEYWFCLRLGTAFLPTPDIGISLKEIMPAISTSQSVSTGVTLNHLCLLQLLIWSVLLLKAAMSLTRRVRVLGAGGLGLPFTQGFRYGLKGHAQI